MSFALATIARGRSVAAAIRVDGGYWPIAAAARAAKVTGLDVASLVTLFDDWSRSFARLRRLATAIKSGAVPKRLALPAGHVRLQTPLQFPRKAYCVGANYQDHLDEMNASSIRKVPGVAPFFFLRPPSTSIVGPGPTVHIPPGCSDFDWEGEMVVVFGKGGADITPERALEHVAGYTLGIDFTARNLLVQPDTFFKFNFTLGKCQDATSPVGPVIVPKAFVDGENLRFSLSVNGVRKQHTSTASMIYSLAEQIAGVSRAVRIEPGDVMFTGSPAGVGAPRGERLQPGDRVVIEAEGIGAMEVEIRPPRHARPGD